MADSRGTHNRDDEKRPNTQQVDRPVEHQQLQHQHSTTVPPSSVPHDVQSAVVHEATQTVPRSQVQGSSDPHRVHSAYTSVKQLELAVAGEPLHRMRRYLELVEATSVELPNSEALAALLITVKTALHQLFIVPIEVDDKP